jgi:hypothetical protein
MEFMFKSVELLEKKIEQDKGLKKDIIRWYLFVYF